MRLFGSRGLVGTVVQSYVEEGIHRHMVGFVGNYKGVHHSYWIDMHLGMVLAHNMLVEVVAKRVDQILVAPPIFDYPILDASFHCNLLFLQHDCNQTHSQRGEIHSIERK
ncbi:hypothetical protein AHAS_Ahas19G0207900 [Arachis hypogaea]